MTVEWSSGEVSWETFMAAKGTVFTYRSDLQGRVAVSPYRGESAAVPIEDLVEFVECVYHGSEWPMVDEIEKE